MPFGDGTGPRGLGPMTGRRVGYCAGYQGPGYVNLFLGRGWFGRGYFGRRRRLAGRGRFLRNRVYTTGMPYWGRGGYVYPPYEEDLTVKDELDMLKDQAEFLKQQLKDIQSLINSLEKDQEKERESE